jgi:hypothetical protein
MAGAVLAAGTVSGGLTPVAGSTAAWADSPQHVKSNSAFDRLRHDGRDSGRACEGNGAARRALREPGKVTLKVFAASDNNRLLKGTRHTVALGANLHIVAVTATVQPPATPLAEGVIYRYDRASPGGRTTTSCPARAVLPGFTIRRIRDARPS